MDTVISSSKIAPVADLTNLLPSFLRDLRAERKAAKTLRTYGEALTQFRAFLEEVGMPTEAHLINREHVSAFTNHLEDRGLSPSTVNNRYRGLAAFFKWCQTEGEIKRNPMATSKPPKVPETAPAVLTDEEITRLLKTVEKGKGFRDIRDHALMRVFLDTGARCAEIVAIRLVTSDGGSDVDLDAGTIRVMGKGERERVLPLGDKAIKALDRYVNRVRSRHPHARSEWLWLGQKGRLSDSGVRQLMQSRGEEAEVRHMHPHRWRHSFAHRWLNEAGSEGGLMEITGWKSREMLRRYAKATANQRAHTEHRRLMPGDRY